MIPVEEKIGEIAAHGRGTARVRRSCVGDGVGILLAYGVMALADGLGVLSAQVGLAGISSTLFFLWFAVVPIPVGAVCNRFGAVRVLRLALLGSVLACMLLGAGVGNAACSVAGFCLAGLVNVCLQVAVPVFASDRFSSVRMAGIVTGGLFAKTAVAVAFPFAVAALSDCGCWWLSLVPFVALSVVTCRVFDGTARERVRGCDAIAPVWNVLKDPVVFFAALAFATAIVADIAFNLAVPGVVSRRFGGGSGDVGIVYAVWFGVKLPLMLLGSRQFMKCDARRFFFVAALVALLGAMLMFWCDGWWAYLSGVGLFAAGFANVYGHVFGAVAPRHPDEMAAASSLLVMAISAGALASPLLACFRDGIVPVLIVILLPLAAYLSCFPNKA